MMYRWKFKALVFASLLVGAFFLIEVNAAQADPVAQIPTVSVPTVTSTPMGAYVTVLPQGEQDQVNLRAGPGAVDYDIVGILIVGQKAPAIGRTAQGLWIEIAYPGAPGGVAWVYSPLVHLVGEPPIVAPPPTPTPRVTPTIDPTFAAQFLVDIPPTRLPTYTPPPPIKIPTFAPEAGTVSSGRLPMGFLIVGMAVVGLFGMMISFLRGR